MTKSDAAAERLAEDVDRILDDTEPFWQEVKGQRLFVTGGTGFFGVWLLECLVKANRRFNLGTSAVVLTRNPERFRSQAPGLAADPAIQFHVGDVSHFPYPTGEFSHIIHMGSTSAEATFHGETALSKFGTIVDGTRRVLEFAARCGARNLLYTSSGAVYGRQPAEMPRIPEEYVGAPESTDASFGLGQCKRAAEFLTVCYADRYGFKATIARCFSFVGPHLQLDIHYAIGNFLRHAINGETIRVTGDGSQWRSYMYVSDLMVWLLTMMNTGRSGRAYNVGSEEAVTIGGLAQIVAGHAVRRVDVRIEGSSAAGHSADRYVPSTQRARDELGLSARVCLDEAVGRTLAFLQDSLVQPRVLLPSVGDVTE